MSYYINAAVGAAVIALSTVAFLFGVGLSNDPNGIVVLQSDRIASTIGKRLNPRNEVSSQGCLAFYYKRSEPNQIANKEIVRSIAVSDGPSTRGIEGDDFGGYWICKFKTSAIVKKEFSVSQHRSSTRIFINGQMVLSGSVASQFEVSFDPGEHIIEVEYENNYSTIGFKVAVEEKMKSIDPYEMIATLDKMGLTEATVHVVDIYESSAQDMSVQVDLGSAREPTVLWLRSHEAIAWKVEDDPDVAAIIVSSMVPGSQVAGPNQSKVFGYQRSFPWPNVHHRGQRCESEILDVVSQTKFWFGLEMDAFAFEYAADHVRTTGYRQPSIAGELYRAFLEIFFDVKSDRPVVNPICKK